MAVTLFDIMSAVSDCVCAELAKPRNGGTEPGWTGDCCVFPGTSVSFDSCCENGGQSWVTVKGGHPSTNFPDPEPTRETICAEIHTMAVRLEVGVIRCVCFDMCDCEVKEDNALNVIQDYEAVIRGLRCCFDEDATGICGDRAWRLNSFEFIGPEGGCAGSKVEIIVAVAAPCCEGV